MAHRGRSLIVPAKDAAMRSKKRSLASRAEARELLRPEDGPVATPAMEELARVVRLKNPEESMLRLTEVMDRSTQLFRNSPDFAIPEVRFTQIDDGRFPYYVTRQINRRGVLVVRGVVPKDAALRWRDSLNEYLEENNASDGTPGARDVFWSKAQAQAREDLRVQQVLSALSRLWKPDSSTPADFTKTLSFCDGAFVGSPTSSCQSGRETAVMAGGTGASERWLSPHYRKAYRDIFEGRWEDWDPFKAGPRMRAAAAQASAWVGDGSMSSPGLEGGGRAPQPFRPFQGYLSLGRWGEKGNIHVVPMMRVATAFMLLRPFMADAIGADVGEADWLCGAGDGPELVLSPKWHQPILDALVRLPPLTPGDAVFWHTDTVHCDAKAVSRDNENGFARGDGATSHVQTSKADFAGIHLSSMPICGANSTYVERQRGAFLDGSPPPACAAYSRETGEKGFAGRIREGELTRGGRRAMGLGMYNKEHFNPALEQHHKLLDISYQW